MQLSSVMLQLKMVSPRLLWSGSVLSSVIAVGTMQLLCRAVYLAGCHMTVVLRATDCAGVT